MEKGILATLGNLPRFYLLSLRPAVPSELLTKNIANLQFLNLFPVLHAGILFLPSVGAGVSGDPVQELHFTARRVSLLWRACRKVPAHRSGSQHTIAS